MAMRRLVLRSSANVSDALGALTARHNSVVAVVKNTREADATTSILVATLLTAGAGSWWWLRRAETAPTKRRAAFDIGSGATKLMIADVRGTTVTNELFGQEIPVSFAVDWKQSSEGKLSYRIQEKGLDVLKGFIEKCDELKVPADARSAIATEVFRKAANGGEYLSKVRKLGIPVKILTQEEEAAVGFMTGVAVQDGPADEVVCWDSGGASFQISSRSGKGGLQRYLGELGTGVVTHILVDSVQGKNFAAGEMPNPVKREDADKLIEELKRKIPDAPAWLRNGRITALGGPNSMFVVTSQALGQATYGPSDVRRALTATLGLEDSKLAAMPFCQGANREPPAYVVPKICLLLAVMEHCDIKEVQVRSAIGSCPGMLVSDDFFAQAST